MLLEQRRQLKNIYPEFQKTFSVCHCVTDWLHFYLVRAALFAAGVFAALFLCLSDVAYIHLSSSLQIAHERLRISIALHNLELACAGDKRAANFKMLHAQEALASRKSDSCLFEELAARRLHSASSRIGLFKYCDVIIFRLESDYESSQCLVFAFRGI